MAEPVQLLFVYGTLRSDSTHPMARLLAAHASPAGHGTVQGRLVSLGPYPGVLLDVAPSGVVHGELHELRGDPFPLLKLLDRYEGADASTRPPLFRRQRTTVTRSDGSLVDAWIYTYARPLPRRSED